MRRTLLALIAVAALAVPHAGAANAPQVVDPKGDYPNAAADILSVLFETRGKSAMTITMELASAPNTPVPYSYQITFVAGDCDWRGHLFGAQGSVGGGCRDDDSAAPTGAKIDGNKVIFTVPAKGRLKPGTILTTLGANNSVGGASAGGASALTGDGATSDKTYKVGS